MLPAPTATAVPIFTPRPDCDAWAPPPLTDAEERQLAALRARTGPLLARLMAKAASARARDCDLDRDHEHLEKFCDDACLVRYLRAARWVAAAAEKRLENTLRWRMEYRPHEIRPEDIEPETHDRQVRFLLFNLETATRCFGKRAAEKLVLVVDLDNWTLRTAPSLVISKQILDILAQHYPERLAAAYIVNAPWLFFTFYKVIYPFIDHLTKQKGRRDAGRLSLLLRPYIVVCFVDMKRLNSSAPPQTEPDADGEERSEAGAAQ
ncbi:MAG: CRAL-TRIO domain-containing protein, partial [Olpidium bornovanus]